VHENEADLLMMVQTFRDGQFTLVDFEAQYESRN